jgi:glycosyltransferase involved in cell wall biosynthesis
MQPLISIIVPVFNGEKYLSEAINGCLNQTYDNIEIIIVNDASTDNTLKIAEDFASKDNRIKIITNLENKKLPASLNIGHKQAKGDYITWTSDDNIYQKDAIAIMHKTLVSSNSDIVYCNYLIIDDEGILNGQAHLKPIENLLFYGVIGACFLYKKEVFERNKRYNENLFLVEDYDFWLRALKHSSYVKIDNPGYYLYRYHNNSLTNKMKDDEELKNQFMQNLQTLYNSFFDDYRIKDKEGLIHFFVHRFQYGAYANIDVIKSNNFFKDLEYAAGSLIGFSFEKLKRTIVNDAIETIIGNKEYQKVSSFITLHKLGGDTVVRLPLKRYFALLKKCLF